MSLVVTYLIWFGYIQYCTVARLSRGEGGIIQYVLLAQIVSTCLRGDYMYYIYEYSKLEMRGCHQGEVILAGTEHAT
jgi:hypothetical protein